MTSKIRVFGRTWGVYDYHNCAVCSKRIQGDAMEVHHEIKGQTDRLPIDNYHLGCYYRRLDNHKSCGSKRCTCGLRREKTWCI